jgi:hypothetical protein
MKNDLSAEIASTKEALINVLNSFDEQNINQVPFEGSWTAGQVAEHVLKSASGVLAALEGNTRPADRDPEQNVAQLRELFLNFEIKMQSPDFIIPSNEPKDKDFLIKALSKTFDGIEKSAANDDLTLICTTFEMPVMGYLSRSEFINFTAVHTQRHIHQLGNILDHITKAQHDNAQSVHLL